MIRTCSAARLLAAIAASCIAVAPLRAAMLPVDQRRPGAQDDSAHDYRAGDLWNLPGAPGRPRGLWRLVDPAPDHAVWHRLPVGTLPADSVPGVVFAHCYGTTRLRANARAPAYTAIPGPEVHPVGLQIARLADQCGSVDATQNDPSSRPSLFPPDRPGDPPALVFASGGLARATLDQKVPVRRWLAFDSRLQVRTRDISLSAVVRNAGLGSANPLAFFDDTVTGGLGVMLADGLDPAHSASIVFGTSHPLGLFVPTTRTLFGLSSDAEGVNARVGDRHALTQRTLVADVVTSGGGRLAAIGRDGAGGYGTEIDAVLIGPALSSAQQALLDAALVDTFGLVPQMRARIIMDGDSRAAGAFSDRLGSPLRRSEPHLARPALLYNLSTGGDTMANRLALFPLQAVRLHDPMAPVEIYVEQAGLNDILLAGRAPEAVENDAERWAAAAHALGRNVVTVRETTLPSAMPSLGRARDLRLLVCLERTASTGFDLIHDLARDDPRFAADGIESDPTLFNDRIHPTDLGYAIWGSGLAATLNRAKPPEIVTRAHGVAMPYADPLRCAQDSTAGGRPAR